MKSIFRKKSNEPSHLFAIFDDRAGTKKNRRSKTGGGESTTGTAVEEAFKLSASHRML
jgi:hypothetical protein